MVLERGELTATRATFKVKTLRIPDCQRAKRTFSAKFGPQKSRALQAMSKIWTTSSKSCSTTRSWTSSAGSKASPPRKKLNRKIAAFVIHSGNWPVLGYHADRRNVGTWTDDSWEAAAMTGLAPVPHDSGTRRGRRTIVGGRRALEQSDADAYLQTSQGTWEATQTRHHCCCTQARHHRERHPQNG